MPFSYDNNKLLATSIAKGASHIADECSPMQIGYFERNDSYRFSAAFVRVAETTAWSWQQSCMAQWIKNGSDDLICFNDIVEGKHVTRIRDVARKKDVSIIKLPLYNITSDGKWGVSINFSRLARFRPGYGYSKPSIPPDNFRSCSADGLAIVNIPSGRTELIVSFDELGKDREWQDDQYLNHAQFSPDGKFVAFFHIGGGEREKQVRFMLIDRSTNNVAVIEEGRRVSHYCWLSNDMILATVKKSHSPSDWQYCRYKIADDLSVAREQCALPLETDGHPMQCPIRPGVIVTDQRANRFGVDRIILAHLATSQVLRLGYFLLPPNFRGPLRCDLHPRWDRVGEEVCVDCMLGQQRRIAVIRLHANEQLVSH
ncbi:hypothetical protein ABC977_08120 [Thioalkalicoccus limnaeus]|uniref:Uncharacterized protein n=1 Tax=Thioalkalicoccus limnaeus TaxID=120681 RepID=A0ABV4BEY7_9GAMM